MNNRIEKRIAAIEAKRRPGDFDDLTDEQLELLILDMRTAVEDLPAIVGDQDSPLSPEMVEYVLAQYRCLTSAECVAAIRVRVTNLLTRMSAAHVRQRFPDRPTIEAVLGVIEREGAHAIH